MNLKYQVYKWQIKSDKGEPVLDENNKKEEYKPGEGTEEKVIILNS